MRHNFRVMLVLMLTSVTIMLGACQDQTSTSKSQRTASQLPVNVPREEVFVVDQIFRYSVIDSFNLWMPGPPSPTRQGLVMDSLWYIDQETGEWLNALSKEAPTYNADFTEMTVKLREGVYWSDGVEFTAADLIFTVNNLKAHPGMFWSAELDLFVKDMQGLDDYTVVFVLNEPNPRFHLYFSVRYNAVWMQPKHIWETVEDPMTFKFHPPVSLGAYEYADSDPAGYWELFKHREDWERTTPGILTNRQGPKYIMTIFYGGSERKAIAMARHEFDLFMNVDYEAFQAVLKKTPTARSWYKAFPWAYPNELDARYFGFNLDNDSIFNNRDVRWALALALDIVDLQTEYIGGVARVTAIPQPAVPIQMKYFHDPMEAWLKDLEIEIELGRFYKPYDNTVTERIAAWARKQGYAVPTDPAELRLRFGTGWWKHAPDVAGRLLRKHGFRKDEDGKWLKPGGSSWTIKMIVAPDEVDIYRLAIGAQDQWADFGIKLELETLEREPYTTRGNMGEFEAISSWAQPGGGLAVNATPDKWQAIFGLHSRFYTPTGKSTAGTGSTNNLRIQSKAIDRIIDELGKIHPDDPHVVELSQEFMKLWVENMYSIVTISFKKFTTIDEYYWTGFPSSENPFIQPLFWFAGGRFAFQYIEPLSNTTAGQ